jgi:anti-anti-sigma factor
MASQQGSVRVCREAETVTFQVVGWGRMLQSMPVRRFAEMSLADGARELRVDLRRCTYVDSTFLGTLLYLRRTVNRYDARLVLVSPAPECCRLFRQMGVEDCLPAVTAEECTADNWTELACEADSADAFNRNVLQAHEELANLGGAAGRQFEAVARGLAKDLRDQDIP